MNYADKQKLERTERRVAAIEMALEAQAELLTHLLDRKAGRPTREEATTLNKLRERVNGTHH